MRKWLLFILGVLIVIFLVVGFWSNWGRSTNWFKNDEEETRINVQALGNENEQRLGTIAYPGLELSNTNLKEETDVEKATFETTDSVDGAVNIYNQDLTNRYRNYAVSRKENKRTEAVDQKEVVLTCKGTSGKIVISVWGKSNGLTAIEVITDKNFK